MSLYVLVIWPTRSAHKTARNKNDHVTTDATSLPNDPPKKVALTYAFVSTKGSWFGQVQPHWV